ncbi:MAG: ChbG/HpnK family deacetylase [Thermoleophilia bacterium]
MKKLIVNADDFGLTEGVNRGILECHERGVVTSTTLLVNGDDARAAAEAAAEHPQLGVGLHLNLTSGKPVLAAGKVSSLIDDEGFFPGMFTMVRRLISGRARRDELAAEVQAQIDKCIELGIKPTHIDSHHHLHALPRLRSVVCDVCRKAGITRMRGYYMSARSLKSFAVATAARMPAGESLKTPDRFSGIEVMGRRDIAVTLEHALAEPGDTLEFMCHPGYADENLSLASEYNSLREVELKALMSEDFIRAIEAAGVRSISFMDL